MIQEDHYVSTLRNLGQTGQLWERREDVSPDNICGIARTDKRINCVDSCGQRPQLFPEDLAAFIIERSQQMGLSVSKSSVQYDQFFYTQLGGDDTSHPSVARIRSTLDQSCGLEIIKEVGHDGPIDAQMLGQSQLTSDVRPSRGGQDLVAAGAAWKFGHGRVGGFDIGPENNAQSPAEVPRQGLTAAPRSGLFGQLIGLIAHFPIIRGCARRLMIMLTDHLYLV
jgi:hypothetical protein